MNVTNPIWNDQFLHGQKARRPFGRCGMEKEAPCYIFVHTRMRRADVPIRVPRPVVHVAIPRARVATVVHVAAHK